MRLKPILLLLVAAAVTVACGESENGTEIDSDECQDFVDTVDITDDIESDRTLESDTRYVVTDNVTVEARLTIEPGTCIAFEQDIRLELREDGVLVADGEADNKIIFTGTEESPGWWRDIRVRSSQHPDNIINHAVVEYAGGGEVDYAGDSEAANVAVGRRVSEAHLAVTNTTIRHGEGAGIFLDDDSDMSEFSNNTITDNSGAPVLTTTRHLHVFDSSSSYSGNGDDRVYAEGKRMYEEVTWEKLDVPYVISDTPNPRDGGKLTIEAGTELQFEQDAKFDIQSDGSLTAKGTEDDPIVFTATEETAGWWQGIHNRSSYSPDNVFEHVVVEYGGGSDDEDANLRIGRDISEGQMNVSDSTFRESRGHGIYIHNDSSVNDDICDVNTFEGNERGGCTFED